MKDPLLNGCGNQFDNINFRSRFFTSCLINNPGRIDIRSQLYDELEFEDTAPIQLQRIRDNGGVRITGWIKPSTDNSETEKASVELKRMYVIGVEPVNAPTAEMINTKYTMVSCAAVILDGNATATPRAVTPQPHLPSPPPAAAVP